jgi:hypothetical protein
MLLVLPGALTLIVLIVSLNIGSLLLAHASGRQQELVRAALGARGRAAGKPRPHGAPDADWSVLLSTSTIGRLDGGRQVITLPCMSRWYLLRVRSCSLGRYWSRWIATPRRLAATDRSHCR